MFSIIENLNDVFVVNCPELLKDITTLKTFHAGKVCAATVDCYEYFIFFEVLLS